MQLNLFTDYALRVLIYAAVRRDGLCTSQAVAATFGISRHHVVKVVHALRKAGYLDTVRGRGGGFRLACRPERIGLGDLVRQTEGTIAVVECFDPGANTCPLGPACGLKDVLREGVDAFFSVLDRYTLADLVAEPRWVARVMTLVPGGQPAPA